VCRNPSTDCVNDEGGVTRLYLWLNKNICYVSIMVSITMLSGSIVTTVLSVLVLYMEEKLHSEGQLRTCRKTSSPQSKRDVLPAFNFGGRALNRHLKNLSCLRNIA